MPLLRSMRTYSGLSDVEHWLSGIPLFHLLLCSSCGTGAAFSHPRKSLSVVPSSELVRSVSLRCSDQIVLLCVKPLCKSTNEIFSAFPVRFLCLKPLGRPNAAIRFLRSALVLHYREYRLIFSLHPPKLLRLSSRYFFGLHWALVQEKSLLTGFLQ